MKKIRFLLALIAPSLVLIVSIFLISNKVKQEVGLNPKPTNIAKIDRDKYLVNLNRDNVIISKEVEGTLDKPYAIMNRWNGEVSLKVGVNTSEEMSSKVEDNKVIWEGKKQEVHFYNLNNRQHTPISNKINLPIFQFPTFKASASGLPVLRHIDLGPLDPVTMSTSYELFQHEKPQTPTILTYMPGEDSYVFYGSRPADRDLKTDKISFPVTRYNTVEEHMCPVIYAKNSGAIIVVYYNPIAPKTPSEYTNQFISAISSVAQKYDVEISHIGSLLYYKEGLKYVQIGRIGQDKNYVIFYLYLNSPLSTKEFTDSSRKYIAIRDGYVIPIIGLKDINPIIDASISDEIINEYAKLSGYSIQPGEFTESEKNIMNNLKPIVSNPEWTFNAYRQDALPQDQADKFEIELILKEKPDTNIFKFDIETEGLNFYFQPELSEKEKDSGKYRPENIIGSYAVYYEKQEKVLKTVQEAQKYKTGKAFHIYRPLIKDGKGKKVWGEMSIDEENKALSITVPQDFLNSAEYPVSVDPTFGYDVVGATYYSTRDEIAGSEFNMDSIIGTGTGTSMSVYLSSDKGGEEFTLGIYNHSTGELIQNGQSVEMGVDGQTEKWYDIPFTNSPTLNANTSYVLVHWSGDPTGGDGFLRYDTGSANQGHYAAYDYPEEGDNPPLPSSIDFTHNSNKYSIYVTYTEQHPPNFGVTGLKLEGICLGDQPCPVQNPPEWTLSETTCNELDGWAWYETNGRGACWSKTLADDVSWNKGVGDDTDNPGAYTCATDVTSLKDRMIAAANGEWYKIVSSVDSVDITSSDNGQSGASKISALAISDCIDGARDLCTGNGCLGANITAVRTSLKSWAGATGSKSALPYCNGSWCDTAVDSDYRAACESSPNFDAPLNCSLINIFYQNRKVCGTSEQNYTWAAAASSTVSAPILGYSSCSFVGVDGTSLTFSNYGFRAVVRP